MDIRQCNSSKALSVSGFREGLHVRLKVYIKRAEWKNLVQCNKHSDGRFPKGLSQRLLDPQGQLKLPAVPWTTYSQANNSYAVTSRF